MHWAPRILPPGNFKQELQGDRRGAGIISGMVEGMEMNGLIGEAIFPGRFFVQPRRGRLQIEDLDDGRPQRPRIAGVETADVVRGDAGLFVGGTRQRNEHRHPPHQVGRLHGIADGEDEWIAGLHARIDGNSAGGTDLQAGLSGQSDFGPHPHGADHQVRRPVRSRNPERPCPRVSPTIFFTPSDRWRQIPPAARRAWMMLAISGSKGVMT